jgi:hypothetical protein
MPGPGCPFLALLGSVPVNFTAKGGGPPAFGLAGRFAPRSPVGRWKEGNRPTGHRWPRRQRAPGGRTALRPGQDRGILKQVHGSQLPSQGIRRSCTYIHRTVALSA